MALPETTDAPPDWAALLEPSRLLAALREQVERVRRAGPLGKLEAAERALAMALDWGTALEVRLAVLEGKLASLAPPNAPLKPRDPKTGRLLPPARRRLP